MLRISKNFDSYDFSESVEQYCLMTSTLRLCCRLMLNVCKSFDVFDFHYVGSLKQHLFFNCLQIVFCPYRYFTADELLFDSENRAFMFHIDLKFLEQFRFFFSLVLIDFRENAFLHFSKLCFTHGFLRAEINII